MSCFIFLSVAVGSLFGVVVVVWGEGGAVLEDWGALRDVVGEGAGL